MTNEVADANRLFETITNLSIAQTQILEMLQQVIPALLEEQREMRSEMQQFHMQIVRLTTLIEAQQTAHTTHRGSAR
jgi:hypothetical protein